MKLVDSFKRALVAWSAKSDPTYGQTNISMLGQPKWRLRDYRTWTDEGYRKNVVMRRCIDAIARHVAQIKFNVVTPTGEELPSTHPMAKLLAKPNKAQTRSDFIRNAVGYYLLAGNSYFAAEGTGDSSQGMPSVIAELFTVRPDQTAPVPGVFGVAAYLFRANGREKTWLVDVVDGRSAMCHWKTFNPLDTDVGMSVVESIAWATDQHNGASEHNMASLQNMGVPSGAFHFGKNDGSGSQTMTKPQREQLRASMDESLSGPKNARRPLLLEGPLTWESMAMTPVEMDFLNSKNLSSREICMGFNTPPQMVGVPGDSTYANYQEARLAFYEEMVLPTANDFVEQLNRWLSPSFNGAMFKVDEDSIPALAGRRKEKWDAVNTSTFITPNEKRIATGYEPLPDKEADLLWVPSGLLPLGSGAAEEAELPEEPELDENGEPITPPTDDSADAGGKPASVINQAPTTDVQSAALNGAQIVALQGLIDSAASGDVPVETVRAVILASFPSIAPTAVDAMLKPLAGFKPPPKPEPPAGFGQPPAPKPAPVVKP